MESDNYLIDQNYFLNNEMNIQNVNNEPFNLAQYFEVGFHSINIFYIKINFFYIGTQ